MTRLILNTCCAVFALALVGCSTLTAGYTYDSADNMWKLGYSDTQLSEKVYRVSFAGYGIPQSQCDDFAIMRAAELTRGKGQKYFRVLNEKQSSSTQSFNLPGTATTTGTISPSGNVNLTTYSSGTTITANYPVTTLTIEILNDKDATANSMDADIIWNSLSVKNGVSRKILK